MTAFSLTMLTGVAITGQHIRFGIGKTIVDSLLIQPLLLQNFRVFEGMRVKRSGFQDLIADRQECRYLADLAQVPVDFTSHGRRKPTFPDGVATIAPARLSISGFALATIAPIGRSLFRRSRNIVAHS